MVSLVGPPTLSRERPADPACDFAALKSEAIGWLQSFAGESWTDYNAHDPGVTILEQLCYALTDLGYRAGFPIRDLLAQADGNIGSGRFGPHPPWRSLPTQPVTVTDFRRLLLDRVDGVANVWILPRTGGADQAAEGLHDIRIQPETPLPGLRDKRSAGGRRLADKVRRMFLHHRPLGEDIGSIRVLRPVRTVVSAELHLDGTLRPARVAAQAIYRLALALAPEPKRLGLADLPEAIATSRLFDGPLALNGFIAGGELGDQRSEILLADLVERLADLPGVVAVRDAGLWVEGHGACPDGTCRIEPDQMFSLDAGLEPEREGARLPLLLTSGGRRCEPDRPEIVRELRRLWADHRRRFPLKSAYRARFEPPRGEKRDLTRFTPIASQFPSVYQLGDGSSPPTSPAAGQLLGFVSIFEMLMVDYCDRLAAVAGLVAGEPQPESRLGSGDLRERIPALAHLAPPEPPGDSSFAPLRLPLPQHEAMLDLLLALYGESAETIPLFPPERSDSTEACRRRIGVKRTLLLHAVPLARRRGRGFDYRAGPDSSRLAGVEMRARLLLGEEDLHGSGDRRRVGVVEHVMLRPRTAERETIEAGRFQYGLAVSAVVELPEKARADRRYRRQIADIVRDSVPAHLGVHMHFVDRERWREFRRLHRLWRMALRLDELPAVDWASAQLRDLLQLWSDEEES